MTMEGSGGTPALLGWVVDVQRDFMDPDGRLYVHDLFDLADPGARMARSAIVRCAAWMEAKCGAIVFTGDWHAYGDREIDAAHPDSTQGTYPPHCMGMSSDDSERLGAALIPEIDPGERALILNREATAYTASGVAPSAVQSRRPIFLQKREISCFEGNHATDPLLAALARELGARLHVIVCGVATDVCVRYAVDGFLDRGMTVSVVRDATWGLGLLPASDTWERWTSRGAHIVTVDALASLHA